MYIRKPFPVMGDLWHAFAHIIRYLLVRLTKYPIVDLTMVLLRTCFCIISVTPFKTTMDDSIRFLEIGIRMQHGAFQKRSLSEFSAGRESRVNFRSNFNVLVLCIFADGVVPHR